MTDVDPHADIELHTANEHVIARVPLAGQVTDEWLRRYQRLARATGVPVQAQAHPGGAWVIVTVPADGNQRDWILDGGGPDERRWAPAAVPDLPFPDQLGAGGHPPGWGPGFFRYLCLV